MEDDIEPLVIDIGSGYLKAGFASDDAPKCLIPMIIGKPKSKGVLVGMDQKNVYIGQEARAKKNLLLMEEPVQAGVITNMDAIQDIISHLFNTELRVSPEEHKVLITEPPNNPPKIREKLVDLMFTEFKVPKLYLGNQAVMSLFAIGRTTGTVLDSGEGITHTVPIYEGYAIPHAITEIPMCGRDLTKFMHQLIHKQNPQLIGDTTNDKEIAELIKCEFGHVALDYDAEMKSASEKPDVQRNYTLPSGQQITLREERLKCPEMLFVPAVQSNAMEIDGIHKYTYDSIMKCENDIKKDLFKNIVLAGGCTMFEGMQARMKKEIQALAPSPMGPDVESPADRKYSAWLGGAILSQIEKFDNQWITKQEFDNEGAKIVHRKCF